MMLIVWFLLSVIAIVVIAVWGVWAQQALWILLQLTAKHRYYGKVGGETGAVHDNGIVVCSHVSLLVAALLRTVSRRPLYLMQQHKSHSWILKQLLWRNRIRMIWPHQVSAVQHKGILLLTEQELMTHLPNTQLPLSLAYVCGTGHVRHDDDRWTQHSLYIQLQLYVAERSTQAIEKAMQYLGCQAWDAYSETFSSIAELWLYQAKIGGDRLSVADSTGVSLSHHRLLVGVMSLREQLEPLLAGQERVGVCLPPSVAGCTTLLVLLSLGKTLVNLNYTAAPSALQSSIQEAGVKTILTSHLFVQTLRKKGFEVGDVFAQSRIIHLEDIRRRITKMKLLRNLLLVKILPYSVLRERLIVPVPINKVAAILFSSGSEGKPKGVELTHKNIIANAKQAAEAMDANANDVFLGLLPIFHAFGLTATTLLPMMEGIPVVCHPDPRDAVAIGHLVQQYQGTIMCGTSTFFRLYAKSRGLTKEMLSSLRFVIAGAERLLPEVRKMFEEKFGHSIYEGYGTTELTPVASANRPDQPGKVFNKSGTIGLPIPGCIARVVDPETNQDLPVGEAGMLVIGGVNVMKGYLNNPEKTAEVVFEQHGIRWYKTGDKAKLDEEGFATILDRYSRFAKLGGEMVSLSAVENQLVEALNDDEVELLAVAVPDLRKGELVILLYSGEYTEDQIWQVVAKSSLNNLMKPHACFKVEAIPKLGTGKTDFSAGKKLAVELLAKGEA